MFFSEALLMNDCRSFSYGNSNSLVIPIILFHWHWGVKKKRNTRYINAVYLNKVGACVVKFFSRELLIIQFIIIYIRTPDIESGWNEQHFIAFVYHQS